METNHACPAPLPVKFLYMKSALLREITPLTKRLFLLYFTGKSEFNFPSIITKSLNWTLLTMPKVSNGLLDHIDEIDDLELVLG